MNPSKAPAKKPFEPTRGLWGAARTTTDSRGLALDRA
jgi:hypothetical protein